MQRRWTLPRRVFSAELGSDSIIAWSSVISGTRYANEIRLLCAWLRAGHLRIPKRTCGPTGSDLLL